VENMIIKLIILLRWLTVKPYGVCLTTISVKNFLVLILQRYGMSCSFIGFQALQILLSHVLFSLHLFPQDPHESRREESLMSAIDYTDSVHNFLLSQKLTTLLWNFPEVKIINYLSTCITLNQQLTIHSYVLRHVNLRNNKENIWTC